MTSTEIEKAIIEILEELQAGSDDADQKITSSTAPLADLGFFDSLLGIETTLALEERLKCKCPDDSVFIDKATSKALTVAQVAKRLAPLVGKAA
jgi:acyl carrier protein